MNKPRKTNILIFPGEAENAFELFQALRYSTRFAVWGASSRPGFGNLLFPRYRDDLPNIGDSDFLPVFNRFLAENEIALIFPTHDDVALYLAEHGESLNAGIIGSRRACAWLCREKKQLYAALRDEPFCPLIHANPAEVDNWPVFVKPNKGQGGVGCFRVDNHNELTRVLAQTPDPLICEYLPGQELTVDCFTNRHGELLFAGPRSRDVVKMGVSFVSRTLPLTPAIEKIATALNSLLKPRGLWFFQTKEDAQGQARLMEASCRAAGAMSVYRQLGVNFPLLAAYDALGMDVRILKNDMHLTLRRRLESRYIIDCSYRTVYVDYDDTLVVDDKVNTLLMQFLYTCLNQGKRLVMLSRHSGDLREDMRRFRIAPELFDQIVHLPEGANKPDFIDDKNAIFIDNLFCEREAVLRQTGIPVFDVDAVEALL
ncbi:carbamoylphosphate synthase large subunit short form [Betaproteobacteria bacterium]|nr:carbamoylphosphate synthase large subunit short form [Betaproteobacteria bacterium]